MPEPRMGFETSWGLVQSAAEGDEAARTRFFETYRPLVRAYLSERWRGSPLQAEVEDAAQDVFVECFKGPSPLERARTDSQGGFRAFLVGIVRHVAQRVERRAVRAPSPERVEDHGDELPDRSTRLSRLFDREWARLLVEEARRLMEQRARELGDDALRRVELLALRFRDGLPIREIAARWSADPARLHHEYAQARGEFAKALREVVAQHTVRREADLDAECERVLAMLD